MLGTCVRSPWATLGYARAMYHTLSRVQTGGSAGHLRAVAARIACPEASRIEADARTWPPTSTSYTRREMACGGGQGRERQLSTTALRHPTGAQLSSLNF
jgi:hypothetical protein